MKRLFLLLTASWSALALAGCDEPVPRDAGPALEMEAPVTPSAEDAAVPAAEVAAPTDPLPPLDNSQLPPANPSSEESVQPESETLFY
ncbi:hypothetical protein IP78_03700 [Brevundimonas sp. AAP58]|uniref:hypothetical protein n=1 Tax=Brevundimonas sp. AAP58 TaxID=1523422 RepID=UPI0006CC9D4D|nr:hypothetical protein [Brevundimonas sp. AAP58]KPF82427.1 hypothetical protein IP78_03700 [Brevundimonas sp. AAP58]